jgi:hypothetical protein
VLDYHYTHLHEILKNICGDVQANAFDVLHCNIDDGFLCGVELRVENLLVERDEVLIESLEVEVETKFIGFYHEFRILLDYLAQQVGDLVTTKDVFLLEVIQQPEDEFLN